MSLLKSEQVGASNFSEIPNPQQSDSNIKDIQFQTLIPLTAQQSLPQNYLQNIFNSQKKVERQVEQGQPKQQKQQFQRSISIAKSEINITKLLNPSSINSDSNSINIESVKSTQLNDPKPFNAHSVIKYILEKNKKKVIEHKINIVNPNAILYRKQKSLTKQFLSSADSQISNRNDNKKCGKKLNQIYKKIKCQFQSLQKLKQKVESQSRKSSLNDALKSSKKSKYRQNLQTQGSSRSLHQEFKPSQQKVSKHLSVSALATYRFKSLKAQNSIISQSLKGEQKLSKILSQLKLKSQCSLDRNKRIQCRLLSQLSKQNKQKQISLRDSITKSQYNSLNTDQYLQRITTQKIQGSKVYGQQQRRLEYVNVLMSHENLERPLAEFAVEFIAAQIKSQQPIVTDTARQPDYPRKDSLYEKKQLDTRKVICYRPRRGPMRQSQPGRCINPKPGNPRSAVLLNHFTFISEYQ